MKLIIKEGFNELNTPGNVPVVDLSFGVSFFNIKKESMVSSSIPEHTLNTNNGWLSPEGKLIPSKVAEHLTLSKKIAEHYYSINIKEVQKKGLHFDPMKFLKKQGWIKLLTWDIDHKKFPGYKWRWLPEDAVPTQKQIDTIFDWCRIRNCALPKFISSDENVVSIVKYFY